MLVKHKQQKIRNTTNSRLTDNPKIAHMALDFEVLRETDMGLCSVELHYGNVLKTISLLSLAMTTLHRKLGQNRPFYRYRGHIELIQFKEYYRMPRGHEHISFVFSSAFREFFS